MTVILSIFGIAFLASFVGGLLGLGGGFILVPLLTLTMNLDIKEAIILSLISLVWLGLFRTIQSRNLVHTHRDTIRPLAVMTFVGSFVATLIGARTPSYYLSLLFSVLLIGLSIFLFMNRKWEPTIDKRHSGMGVAKGIFFGSGMLGGLLGLGGGIFNVPALHRLLHYPMSEATKLNFPFILISGATALGTFYMTKRDLVQSLPLAPVAALLVGTFLGGTMSGKAKISSHKLKSFFALILLAMGVLKLLTTH